MPADIGEIYVDKELWIRSLMIWIYACGYFVDVEVLFLFSADRAVVSCRYEDLDVETRM